MGIAPSDPLSNGMLPKEFGETIRILYGRLKHRKDVLWAFTGSVGFALQGLDLIPKDIDIQTDRVGAFEIERIFSDFVVEKVRFRVSEIMKSYFGVLSINKIKVEIMGNIQKKVGDRWEEPVDIAKYLKFVEFEDMYLPVLDLKYEMEAYRKLGRFEKAKMLEEYLKRSD